MGFLVDLPLLPIVYGFAPVDILGRIKLFLIYWPYWAALMISHPTSKLAPRPRKSEDDNTFFSFLMQTGVYIKVDFSKKLPHLAPSLSESSMLKWSTKFWIFWDPIFLKEIETHAARKGNAVSVSAEDLRPVNRDRGDGRAVGMGPYDTHFFSRGYFTPP